MFPKLRRARGEECLERKSWGCWTQEKKEITGDTNPVNTMDGPNSGINSGANRIARMSRVKH